MTLTRHAGTRSYLVHQTPRANRAALPHPHTSQNRHVGPNPAVLLNHDVPAKRRSLRSVPPPRINRICRAYQLDVRAKYTPRSDRDTTCVRDAAIGAEKHVIAHSDIVAIITVEWGLDYAILAHAAEGSSASICSCGISARDRCLRGGAQGQDLSEQTDSLFRANAMRGVRSIVKTPDGLNTVLTILDQYRMIGHIVKTLQHLFTLTHAVVTPCVGWSERDGVC